MKVIRSIICIIVGIIVGVVLTVGGLLGFGYNFLTKNKMGDILDKSGIEGEFTDTIRELTVLEYVNNLLSAISDFQNASIGQLEDAIGYKIADMMNEALGIDTEVLRNSSLTDLPEAIMNNLTLDIASEKFGVALPEFPLFQDREFMSKPISEAFGGLDTCTLDQFIEVIYDEDASLEKPASMGLLQRFGKMQISELSSDMDGVIDDTKLSEVISADEDSLIYEFLDLKIGELGTKMDDKIKSMTLGKFVDVNSPDTPKILKNLADCSLETVYEEDGTTVVTYGLSNKLNNMPLAEMVDAGDAHIWNYLGIQKISNLGEAIDHMTLADALEITDDTNILLKKLRDKKITQLGTEINNVIADTSVGELIELGDDAPPILRALSSTKMNADDLKAAVDEFTISDIFEDVSTGILGLVPAATRLNALPGAIGNAISNANVYKLDALGVINVTLDENSNPEIKAKIYNNTAATILSEYIDVLNDPISAASMLATKKHKFGGNTLTQSALDAMGVKQGETVVLTQDTVIPAGETFTVPFNILADYEYAPDLANPTKKETGNYTLTIKENVKINGCGYLYIQAANATKIANMTATDIIEISSADSLPAVKIELVQKNS